MKEMTLEDKLHEPKIFVRNVHILQDNLHVIEILYPVVRHGLLEYPTYASMIFPFKPSSGILQCHD